MSNGGPQSNIYHMCWSQFGHDTVAARRSGAGRYTRCALCHQHVHTPRARSSFTTRPAAATNPLEVNSSTPWASKTLPSFSGFLGCLGRLRASVLIEIGHLPGEIGQDVG
jgi:hypothetical protein